VFSETEGTARHYGPNPNCKAFAAPGIGFSCVDTIIQGKSSDSRENRKVILYRALKGQRKGKILEVWVSNPDDANSHIRLRFNCKAN
jgi:hypothetical protein